MTRQDSFKEFVLDQLAAMESITCRAMFGGSGCITRAYFSASCIRDDCTLKPTIIPRPAYEDTASYKFLVLFGLDSFYECLIDNEIPWRDFLEGKGKS